MPSDLLSSSEIARLRWRARRGLLENDLFLESFFTRFGTTLNQTHAVALDILLELPDQTLLALLLQQQSVDDEASLVASCDLATRTQLTTLVTQIRQARLSQLEKIRELDVIVDID